MSQIKVMILLMQKTLKEPLEKLGSKRIKPVLSYRLKAHFLYPILGTMMVAQATYGFTVIVDPGHGGADKGATHGPFIESEITFTVAKLLQSHFETNSKIRIILTRQENENRKLSERSSLSTLEKADLFISLHSNSSKDARVKGVDFFIAQNKAPYERVATPLKLILSDIDHKTKLYGSHLIADQSFQSWSQSQISYIRSIRQAPFYVINKNSVPSLLVELGFITNPDEAARLSDPQTQKAIVNNLAQTIEDSYRISTTQ